jgi:hypothetical protein
MSPSIPLQGTPQSPPTRNWVWLPKSRPENGANSSPDKRNTSGYYQCPPEVGIKLGADENDDQKRNH